MSDTINQYRMQDPTKQYPGPHFERQPQPAPGLAQNMSPQPDHGERSYQGFGRLKGRRARIFTRRVAQGHPLIPFSYC
jgi:hypothetical protein